MISVEEAQQRVLAEIAVIGTEQIAFTEAIGRVLREDVVAPADVPQADNTAMDGYAVRADDIGDRGRRHSNPSGFLTSPGSYPRAVRSKLRAVFPARYFAGPVSMGSPFSWPHSAQLPS